MPALLHRSDDLPAPGAYDHWFAVTGADAPLDKARKLSDLAVRLEGAFDAIRDDWWRLGRELGAEPTGDLAYALSCAAFGSDMGLMMAWHHLAGAVAAEDGTCLIVCDDPWLFRSIAEIAGVSAGAAPALWTREVAACLRGAAARTALALRLSYTSLAVRRQRSNHGPGKPSILVYGHPQSTADGYDAYFGDLMRRMPSLTRLLHTDCPAARARELGADGRTASLHAWGNPFYPFRHVFTRWRPGRHRLAGPFGWIVRRTAAMEGRGALHAMNRWYAHCQRRWFAGTRPACIAWPWENLTWERLLVRLTRRLGIRTVGYQHTDVGPQQYNMSARCNPDGLASIPDRLILNGPAYRDQLEYWGVPASHMTIGGSFRIGRFEGNRYDPEGPVFVALSGIVPIALQMIDAVKGARGNGLRFLVKEHPMYPVDFEETDDIRRTDRSIDGSSGLRAVLFGTGTSGIEALLAGVPTFRFLPDDRVSLVTMPDGLVPVPVTRNGLKDALTARRSPPDVRWDDLFAEVDGEIWARELAADASAPHPNRSNPS